MPGLLEPHHGAIFHCPLCAWKFEVAPVAVDANTLAGVFGPQTMRHVANTSRLERIERALHDHLSEHSLVDWLKKVRELEDIRARLAEMPEAERVRLWESLREAGICANCGHNLDEERRFCANCSDIDRE